MTKKRKYFISFGLGIIASAVMAATIVSCSKNTTEDNNGENGDNNGDNNGVNDDNHGEVNGDNNGEVNGDNNGEANKPIWNPVESIPTSSIDEDYSGVNISTPIENIGNTKAEITERYNRTQIPETYTTDLQTQYPNLKYPGWDNNYRNYTLNGFTPTTMNVGSKSYSVKNISEAVWCETTEFNGQRVRYSDPSFIRNEIKQGTFKKHPAANNRYHYDLTNDTQAVKKIFSLPSTARGITSLGLYAPAGEVCTLKFTKETLTLMKLQGINNFQIWINDSYWDIPEDDEFNDRSGKTTNRYPFLATNFTVKLSDISKDGTYQFGTPFGGSIAVFIDTPLGNTGTNDWYPSYHNYEFEITGACENIYYSHGVTTKEQWDDMINRYINPNSQNKITAPNLTLDFAYGSMNISANINNKNTFADTPIKNIVFPKSTLDKWTGFLFISEYFASRDEQKNVRKIHFRFGDNIWGGAGAWGGGDRLSAPISWASSSFLTGADNWTIKNNWGTFHEINHNFQQNSAIWQLNSHGETNQVTMAAFSLLGDNGRWRNKYNWTGEYGQQYSPKDWAWERFQNMYSIIAFLNNLRNSNRTTGEYDIYGLINFLGGSYNYMNYVRNDIATSNGVDSTDGTQREGGFYEILELSNFYKLNFWPALENYYPLWHDEKPGWSPLHKWPSSYNTATSEQKKQIDELKKYKSFDFVGNLYSCGSYLWNDDKQDFIYTGDMNAPYQIPAGESYVLDFENGINSVNTNFQWDNLTFPTITKAGGTLQEDPKNPKKLIYTPNKNAVDVIDEFDISISPSKNYHTPDNYVPSYKWKIKIRQATDAPIQTIFSGWNDSVPYNINNYVNDMKAVKNGKAPTTYRNLSVSYNEVHNPTTAQGVFNDTTSNNQYQSKGTMSEFYFVAPEAGNYQFQIKSSIDTRVEIDGKNVYEQPGNKTAFENFWSQHLEKGQKIKISTYVIYRNDPILNYQVLKDGEPIDFMKCVLNENAFKLAPTSASDFLTDKYRYQSRKIDYNNFQTSMFGLNASREKRVINGYRFQSTDPNLVGGNSYKVGMLRDHDDNYMEVITNPGVHEITLKVDAVFTHPVDVKSIIFYHRTNNHSELRPTKIKVTDENDNVLYDGAYGAQKNDRGKPFSVLTLSKTATVNRLKFTFYNNQLKNNATGIIFDCIQFSSDYPVQINKSIPINSETIWTSGSWKLLNNSDGENISPLNQVSYKSSKYGDVMEFNIFAEGFDIIGQLPEGELNLEIIVNGEPHIVQLNSSSKQYSKILFQYTCPNNGENLNVKIINRSSQPIYIDYIQTYGEYVKF